MRGAESDNLHPSISAVAGELTERLRADGVVAAYVFGSLAHGPVGPLSDVDLAVLFADAVSPDEQHDRRLRMMCDLTVLFPGRQVDVLNLRDAAPAVAYNAVKDGQLLFSDDEPARVRCVTRILLIYLDVKPLLERHAEAILRP